MVFSLNKKYAVSDYVRLKGEENEQVSTFEFLGVIIDKRWCWSDHIQYINLKCSNELVFCIKQWNIRIRFTVKFI